MSGQNRQAFETLCRDIILHTSDRMERLRSTVERADLEGREDWERALDTLRGQRNRTMARMEAAHIASDEAWSFARAKAEHEIAELMRAIDDLDHRLRRLAA